MQRSSNSGFHQRFTIPIFHFRRYRYKWPNPRGLVANVLDSSIVVSEFGLQSRYCVHFRTNTLGKRYELPYPTRYVLNRTAAFLLHWYWNTHEGWYAIIRRNQTRSNQTKQILLRWFCIIPWRNNAVLPLHWRYRSHFFVTLRQLYVLPPSTTRL